MFLFLIFAIPLSKQFFPSANPTLPPAASPGQPIFDIKALVSLGLVIYSFKVGASPTPIE